MHKAMTDTERTQIIGMLKEKDEFVASRVSGNQWRADSTQRNPDDAIQYRDPCPTQNVIETVENRRRFSSSSSTGRPLTQKHKHTTSQAVQNDGQDSGNRRKCSREGQNSPMMQQQIKAVCLLGFRVPGVRAECARAFVASGRPAQTRREWHPPSGRRR